MTPADTKAIIADLADRFAQIGIPVLEAARAQAPVTVILGVLALLMTLLFAAGTARCFLNSCKASPADELPWVVSTTVCGIATLSFLTITTAMAGQSITALLNPDWYAITKVIDLIGARR